MIDYEMTTMEKEEMHKHFVVNDFADCCLTYGYDEVMSLLYERLKEIEATMSPPLEVPKEYL